MSTDTDPCTTHAPSYDRGVADTAEAIAAWLVHASDLKTPSPCALTPGGTHFAHNGLPAGLADQIRKRWGQPQREITRADLKITKVESFMWRVECRGEMFAIIKKLGPAAYRVARLGVATPVETIVADPDAVIATLLEWGRAR